jgi:SAM-dependent methyltransferase
VILPPGTILQRMYLKERLARLPPGRFVEVGVGSGHVTATLLERGWTGVGYEASPPAAQAAAARFRVETAEGRFRLEPTDWLSAPPAAERADLVISSMVLEHLSPDDERRYLRRCERELAAGGRVILIVPASPAHWGVEDEIAGHYRRYARDSLRALLRDAGWDVEHLAGLTFPVSNVLLRVSNFLVERAESSKRRLTRDERTASSGHRAVRFKTMFPASFGLLLNETLLYPWHLVQKAMRHRPDALVLYVECRPAGRPRAAGAAAIGVDAAGRDGVS